LAGPIRRPSGGRPHCPGWRWNTGIPDAPSRPAPRHRRGRGPAGKPPSRCRGRNRLEAAELVKRSRSTEDEAGPDRADAPGSGPHGKSQGGAGGYFGRLELLGRRTVGDEKRAGGAARPAQCCVGGVGGRAPDSVFARSAATKQSIFLCESKLDCFASLAMTEVVRASHAARNIGGARRDRTADLLHAMQALSQLSYGP
jgi:hypothetical protein